VGDTQILLKVLLNTHCHETFISDSKTTSVALSPQANYTDRAMPLVGDVSGNFVGRVVSRCKRNGFLQALFSVV
jgi:hypothetical protein